MPIHLLSRLTLPDAPSRLPGGMSALCRTLVVDSEASCTRLTKGLGDGAVDMPSVAAACGRLMVEHFDAVLLVAGGFGHSALSVRDVESIVLAADAVPVLVIVEEDDRDLARHAINSGAFDTLVRGTVAPEDVRRRIAQAVELSRLRAYRASIDKAIKISADALFITNSQGLIEWCNDVFERFCGFRQREVIGKNPRDLLRAEPQDSKHL